MSVVDIIQFVLASAILGYCTYTDIKKREISNIACVFLFLVWLCGNIYYLIARSFEIQDVCFRLLGGIVVLALMLLVSYLFEKFTRKPSFGGGDIKLIAICCLFFDARSFLEFVFLACLVGVGSSPFTKDKEQGIPFAPAILIAFVVVFLRSNILVSF